MTRCFFFSSSCRLTPFHFLAFPLPASTGKPLARYALLYACLRAHLPEVLWGGFWCLGESATMVVQPLLLRSFVAWLQDTDGSLREGLLFAMGLALVSLAQAIVHHALYLFTMRMGWNLRIGMSGLLHWKLLRLSSSAVAAFGPGKVINLISTDVLR